MSLGIMMIRYTQAGCVKRSTGRDVLMKNPTAIASFEIADSAEQVARKLRDAGFDARVRGSAHFGSGTHCVTKTAGISRVVVPAVQTVRALSWCREFDAAESLLSDAWRCPECGSTRVATRIEPQLPPSGSNEGGKASGPRLHCEVCHASWRISSVPAFAHSSAAA
jgi:hypothetical protein